MTRTLIFAVNSSTNFASKTRKYCAMMTEIDTVTKFLQQIGRTLSECRADLDILISAVEGENQEIIDSVLLQTEYEIHHS